jgi:ATP-dependent helicase/nuclease subunit B
LKTVRPALDSVASFTCAENLPPLWAAAFQQLEGQGVSIIWKQPTSASSTGDLAAVRKAPFVPKGDGSLVLLRRHGPLDTADEVAATLAAMTDLNGVIVIGADAILDEALARHGLPVSGQSGGATASSRLLNLVIETAFCPMDLGFLQALLTSEISPIPRALGAQLVRALQQMPGRGTEAFEDVLQKAIDPASDDQSKGLADRVKHFVLPAAAENADSLPAQDVDERVTALEEWARGRIGFEPSLQALLTAIARFRTALTTLGDVKLSRQALRRLCADVGVSSWSFRDGQAGLIHVHTPGAIVAPAKIVVWWGFSRNSAPRAQRLFLSEDERKSLDLLGVAAPDARLMNAHADAWRRPLLQAQSQLLLVCPQHEINGERAELHPLWDEIVATMPHAETIGLLVVPKLTVPVAANTKSVAAQPLVRPAQQLKARAGLKLREAESPSSIERLLGCSLSWALRYVGHVAAGLSAPVPEPGPLLNGSIAHSLLEKILLQPNQTEMQAANFAASLFDEQPKDDFEALHLPQYQTEKAALRLAVVESARALVRLMCKYKAEVSGTEVLGQVTADGQVIKGRSDFVWKTPAVIWDFKWGKSSPRAKLFTGTHLQLAAYAAMHAKEGVFPETAYFSLMSQSVLAEPNGILQHDGEVPGTQTVTAIWKGTLAAIEKRRNELGLGIVEAPGATGEDQKSSFSGSTLLMAPDCAYCGYAALCGRGAAR